MVNKTGQRANRIPVHFVDDEQDKADNTGADTGTHPRTGSAEDNLSSEEIGREDEAEEQPATDQGQLSDGPGALARSDEPEAAGGEAPERGGEQGGSNPSSSQASARNSAPPPKDDGASSSSAAPEATGPILAELIATRAELRRVEAERNEMRESLARRQADFENFRKRVERDRNDSYNRLVGDVVSKLLPVLDNLRRALDAEETVQANESKEFRHFLHGVELISKQLSTVLEGLGLQQIDALGHPFDPHIHEAVITEQTDEYEPDTVIQEIVPGYRLGEKLLRPAIVKVATR
jgi:molecular chaperone GrpE